MLPSLDPSSGGVSDYGLQLAQHWPGSKNETYFFSGTPLKATADWIAREAVCELQHEADVLLRRLEECGRHIILLHYVGYGYSPNACPRWLLDGLTRWKQARPGRRLFIYFHELATEEPCWKCTYWTQAQQRQIIRGLVRLADRVATSCVYFAHQLQASYGADSTKLTQAPIPATLSPRTIRPQRVRVSQGLKILIFGLAGSRRRVFNLHHKLLRKLAKMGRLQSVAIAGRDANSSEGDWLAHKYGIEVLAHSNIDEEKIAELAANADFGLVWNWPSILTKSTVFANFCALGLPSIISLRGGTEAGLPILPAYLSCDGSSEGVEETIQQMTTPAIREELSRNTLKLAATFFSWPTVSEHLYSHFVCAE